MLAVLTAKLYSISHMLGPMPFAETTSPETLFDCVSDGFRTRMADYAGTDIAHCPPLLVRVSLDLPSEDDAVPAPPAMYLDFPLDEQLPRSVPLFAEDLEVGFGFEYDFPVDDARYRRLPILRHFVEISFGVPLPFNFVEEKDRAKAIGTLIFEYQGEMTKILNDMGIDTIDHEIYEIAEEYPEEAEAACLTLLRTAEEHIDFREVRTLRYQLSERERTIRRSFTCAFESGMTTTILSSITTIDDKICEDESAIPNQFANNPEVVEHDTELEALFTEILAGLPGIDASVGDKKAIPPMLDNSYRYATEIWRLLDLTYAPYKSLAI